MSTPSIRWTEVPANAVVQWRGTTTRKFNLVRENGHIEAQVFEYDDGSVAYQTDLDWSRQKWARTIRDAQVAAQNNTATLAATRPPPDSLVPGNYPSQPCPGEDFRECGPADTEAP